MQRLCSLRSSISASFALRFHGTLNSISRHAASPGLENLGGRFCFIDNVVRGESARHMLRYSGNLGMDFGLLASKEDVTAPYALSFRSFIHSSGQKDFETGRGSNPTGFTAHQEDFEMERSSRQNFNSEIGRNPGSMDIVAGPRDFGMKRNPRLMDFSADGRNSRPMERSSRQNFNSEIGRNPGSRSTDFVAGPRGFGMERNPRPMDFSADGRNSRSMDFVKGIIEQDGYRFPRYHFEQNEDFVFIKLTRNNTFVAVTDSKGNKKKNASMTAGWLQKQQGGAKLSRYAAEATAEHVGQSARQLGLKSFVMRVNGFMFFRKKRQAIMSFAEGYGKGGRSPITHIEDTTRRPHNGCRLPRKRRI